MKHLIKTMAFTLLGLMLSVNLMATDFQLSSKDNVTQDGITISFAANGGTTPAWYDAGLRLYAKNTITIYSSNDITAITFNWEKQGSKDFASASASVGSYSHPSSAGVGTWTGSAKSVTFTLGNAGQLQLNTLSVTAGSAPTAKINVTLSRNGSTTTIKDQTAPYSLPAAKDEQPACEGWEFKGWSNGEVSSTTDAPEFVTEATATSTYYAVYGKAEGDPTKVTTKYTLNGNWTTDNGNWTIVDGNLSTTLASGKYGLNNGSSTASSPQSYSNISSVQFTGTKSSSGSGTVEVWYKSGSSWVSLGSKSFSTTLTWTPATPVDGELKMKLTRSGGNVYIASVSVTYSAASTTYTTSPECAAPKEIDHIEVTGTPAEFWKGDAFNNTGMTVNAYYTEGDPDDVTGSATYSGYDMSVAGEQTVTVTYKSKTDTYKINVQTIANTEATAYTTAKAIELITAGKDLTTEVYVKGTISKVDSYNSTYKSITYWLDNDAFEIYGGLAKEGESFSSKDDLLAGDVVVVKGKIKKFNSTYEMDMNNVLISLAREKKLTSITVSGTPDYFDTQSSFNHNGMTVTAHYNTGASDDADVTASAEFTAPDMTTTGEKTVNVSYTEDGVTKETSYKINVGSHCNIPVTITKGTPAHGSFTLSAEGNQCADGLVVSVTPNAAEHYHFKQITATNGDVDNNAKTVSNITANTTINVEFEEDEKVTVTWHIGATTTEETANVYVGTAFADVKAKAPFVADNAAGDCANKFMGWATSVITAQDGVDEGDVAWATEVISNENKDFYAVWAKATGSTSSDPAVTFDFTDSGWGFPTAYQTTTTTYTNGGYSINLTGTGEDGYKQFTKSISGGGTENVSLIIGKSGATMLLPKFNFPVSKIVCDGNTEGGGTKVTFNIYNGETEVSTSHTGCKENGIGFAIAETAQSSQLTLKVTNANNLQISKMYFYAGASFSNYITSCFVPTYSVTIQSNDNTMGTAAINPEHIKNAYKQGDEIEVKATVTDGAIYRFVNWTIEPATTGASLYMGANEAENLLTVGSGNITLTANFEAIPADPITVTLEVGEHGTLECDDCQGNTITEETAGEGVLVPNVIANEGWAFLGWSTSSTATEAEYKPADADIFYPSDDNKTLYAIYAQLYKVTLKYTDEVLWQETVGGSVTLPSRNCKNATYKDHFAGWSTTEFAEETINPTETPTIYVESITPTEDVVLYPVFSVSTMGGTKWVKKTINEVEEGDYAIITTDGHAFNGSISDGHGQVTENTFTFDANNIATSVPTGICEITMQPYKNDKDEVKGYKMYNADKGYLYAKDAASKNLAWHNTEDTYWCVWSSNWEYYKNYDGKYAYLRSYNNSSFRTYSTNSGDVLQFAKKESVAENKYWSKPANDVTNPVLDTPAGDYLSPLTVKITEDSYDENLIYYYTTDGTTPAADELLEPTGTSIVYDHTTGIVLEPAKTYNLQVIGYDEDGYTSQIASATYVLYPVFNSISAMYAGATNDKPVGLVLTNAYVHAVNTIGANSQIFVQQGDLGVVLSTTTVPDGVVAGKQISGTAVGKYTINNGRPQISQFAFQSTFSATDGTRPEPTTITQTTADLVSTNLLGLVKLEGVYAQSDASNIIVVTENTNGTGKSSNVYDFFNKVSTIPASDVKCNVIGLFNERKEGSNPIVYSIMPILDNDFDVVEKQNATLPEVSPLGSTVEAEPTKVASGETVTITPAAGFTTSYKVNGGEKQTITTQSVPVTITESNTTIVVEATRPYYNDASATYYYEIDPGLTKYHITLPSVQTYYKIVSDVTDQKAGETVTLTISNITEHWNITGVTVEKADDETTTVEVANPETNIYTFVMPAYAVNVKVDYESDPTYKIDYLKGLSSGVTGDDITESKQYAGVELALKECTWKAAGYTFKNWYAYYLDDESQEVAITITDNKIIVPAHDVKIKAMWDEAAWHKDGTWELVTKTSELGVGDYVIFTDTQEPGDDVTRYAGTSTIKGEGKNLQVTKNISISGNKLTRTNNDATMIFQIETGNETNTYAFYADGIGYLNANGTGTNNYMITTESKASTNASWEIVSIDATTGEAVVKAKSENRNQMQVNVSNSIFAAYNSKQGGLAIYKFYPKAWTVTFDDNVEDEEIAVPDMQRADPTTNKVTISTDVPVRTGYDFSKWNSAKGGIGELTVNPGDEITLTANKTLYAQWNIKQYNVAVAEVENVTIQAKPHSEEAIVEGANADVNFKKSVVLSYSELNEDYVFKSWKVTKAGDETTEVPVSVGSSTTFEVPAYAVTVSAVIESKATTQLTVTYHANGGVNKTPEGPKEVSEQVYWNTTIKFAEHPCPFEKNLCTFAGWNTKADGSGTTYKTQVTVKTDIDLYAMWEASAVEYVLDNNVEAKVSVKEGLAPEGSAAAYTTDYSTLGQLTNGKYGTLTLTGYAGKVITGVKMEMKTNKSGGAGTIVVKVGDTEICSTSYSESFGSYSQSYIVASLLNFVPAIVNENEEITIKTVSSENSLYINGYTIEYEDIPEETIVRSGLTSGQYTTYCEPQTVLAGTYTGATFWNIESKTTMDDGRLSSITIVQHDGALVAGVPYIMLPESDVLTGKKCSKAVAEPAAEDAHNGLVGVFEDTPFSNFDGDAATVDAAAAERGYYVISNGILYLCGNNCGVYANYAYIVNGYITDQSANTPPTAPRRTIGNPNGTPTTLNGLNGNQSIKSQKALIDGHIYILRGNKMYNAQGQFVK